MFLKETEEIEDTDTENFGIALPGKPIEESEKRPYQYRCGDFIITPKGWRVGTPVLTYRTMSHWKSNQMSILAHLFSPQKGSLYIYEDNSKHFIKDEY